MYYIGLNLKNNINSNWELSSTLKLSPFVEVEKGNQIFEKRFVKTGLSDGINIEILEGIQKTDKLKMPQLAEEPKE